MPTKRALPAKPASAGHFATNLAQLQQDAERSMAGKHFREAIMHYKALLKAAPGPLWQDGLAGAYRGRAMELADKGMLQEALGIWENRSQFCPQAPPDIEEVFLHLHLGRFQSAASIF